MKLPSLFKRSTPAPEKKQSATGSAIVVSAGQPAWSNRDYASFADEGYRRNVVVYQAVNKIADAVASVRWTLWNGDTEITEHPLLNLLKNPNPLQSGPQYIRAKVGFLMLSGNGYEERVTVGGEVKEIYQLRPDRMKIIPAVSGFPKAYVYEVNGRKVAFPVDDNMGSDVRHLRLFNPLDDFYGMSPIEAGAYAVDQHNQSMGWMQGLLNNSARPSGALVYNSDQPMGDEQFNALKAQIDEQYSGARNAGRPMLLEGGLDWKAMGLSPVDMELLETKYSAARDVSLALGVPPQMLGIRGDNTYSNYQEARLSFWEDTVIPLLDMIAADWNSWLAEGDGLTLKPDLDQIPAIADKRQRLWEMADQSTDLTVNERRELKGYGPVKGGDVLLVSAAQVAIDDLIAPTDPNAQNTDPNQAGIKAYGKANKPE